MGMEALGRPLGASPLFILVGSLFAGTLVVHLVMVRRGICRALC